MFDSFIMRKNGLMINTDSEGSDQPVHKRSVTRIVHGCLKNRWVLWNILANNEGPDQTARMRSLIWASSVRKSDKVRFLIPWLKF